MLKRLLVTTAIGGLIATGALAQTPPPASPPAKSPPAATEPAPAPKAQAPSPGAKADAKNMVISEQKPDQWLASKFRGTDVIGPKDEKIGDVADVLFDKSGKVEAIVIGVGGFLGMGQKQVALTLASFDIVPGKDNESPKLRLNMSKEQLQQAAEFKPYNPPRPAATPPANRPSPGGPGTRPSPGTGN
jgi:hypothetical protein